MEPINSFGYWIRRQRKALDLTQQALADRVGCSLAAIKKIEADERRPSRQIAERLADVLGISTGQHQIFLEVARGLRPVDQLSLAHEPSASPAAAKVQDSFKHNLPMQLTSFIGRERELDEVRQLLANTRLLTFSGPGGTGKTRLSLQIAQELLPEYTNGVWLVELAPLTDPSLIPQTIASVFELREAPNTLLMDILIGYLRAKQLLLILDNCEHLIAACAKLSADLLRVCPQLKIIASSREALGISGEVVYRVPSLSLPNPAQVTPERVLESEAGQLFVERAGAVQPHFALQKSNASAISQICHRLDGIPLALELAAARVAVFSPEEIASRLDDRFRLLTGGSRAALERHQTLRASIDWSYDLLSGEERRLFCQLSAFAGGWTFESAESICSDLDVLSLLPQLVNKSLVLVEEGAEGSRYRLPESIRQYAREKLYESGEAEKIRHHHLEFFVGFAETAEPKLRSGEQVMWLERVETEYENLRTALAWSLESGKSDRALRLAGTLGYFWEVRGYAREGCQWLDEALALSEHERGGRDAAEESPTRAELRQYTKALYADGRLHFLKFFDPIRGRTRIEESLRISREIGDRWQTAVALEHLGWIAVLEGDIQTAQAQLKEGISLAREIEDRWPLALCLLRLVSPLMRTDAPRVHQIAEEGVRLARSLGDQYLLCYGLTQLASAYFMNGSFTEAVPPLEEVLVKGRLIGGGYRDLSLFLLVVLTSLLGDLAQAKSYFFQLLAHERKTGFAVGIALIAQGWVASFSEESWGSVQLLAAAEVAFRKSSIKLDTYGGPILRIYEQALEKGQAQLDPAAFQAAWAEGQKMTLEQAITLVMEKESDDLQRPK